MKTWRRLVIFLLLNVVISACTTLAVLWVWDQTRSPIPGGVIRPAATRLAEAAQRTPTPAAPAGEETPQPTATPAFTTHKVQPGDTLESIAQAYGITVDQLMSENGIANQTLLGDGEMLRIPIYPTPAPVAVNGGVAIDSVIGAGDLEAERVLLRPTGESDLSLFGWQLVDEDGNGFIFPDLKLYRGGAVYIFTKPGANTVVELYWGLQEPVWQSGETVTLNDSSGAAQATYQVP